MAINFAALADKFDPLDIEWRIQQSGFKNDKPWAMVLAYLTSRAVQQRLDDVCGPTNWQNRFLCEPDQAISCGISIYDEEKKEWITKWDAADATDIEAIKGGRSGAMKRAAVHWGIGRYLYSLDATFAECITEKPSQAEKELWHSHKDKTTGQYFYWKEPTLPKWATPHSSPDVVAKHNEAVRTYLKAILDIKEGIAEGDYMRVVSIWAAIPEDDRKALWLAPSKGGVFSSAEIAAFKSDDMAQARAEFHAGGKQ